MSVEPKILLFKGRGIVSWAIRFQTRSKYSHAAILMPNGNIIESWQGKGVQINQLKNWDNIDVFSVDGMTDEQWKVAIDFALEQKGKKYDYSGVFRFLSRRRKTANGDKKWFCSELVFHAIQHAAMYLLQRIQADEVAPGHLSLSPLLILDK